MIGVGPVFRPDDNPCFIRVSDLEAVPAAGKTVAFGFDVRWLGLDPVKALFDAIGQDFAGEYCLLASKGQYYFIGVSDSLT